MKDVKLDWFSHAGAVRLKTGGPLMTVVDYDPHFPFENGSRGGFFCTWVDCDGLFLHEDVFSPESIAIVPHAGKQPGWEQGE